LRDICHATSDVQCVLPCARHLQHQQQMASARCPQRKCHAMSSLHTGITLSGMDTTAQITTCSITQTVCFSTQHSIRA
jgi:hypothetical protein